MEIPGYTILRELGRGGMATVYLAKQDRLGRKVALKVMQPLPNTGDDFTARFIKEGRIIAQLQHPKIVTIYDFDIVDGYHYFSMEHLPNGTLSDAILKGMSVERAIEITRGIAEALAVAHDHGVIHRDIKPQNVLFRADGTPVLTDFGIARAAGAGAEVTQVTHFGMIIGSPRYMSPEQSQSKPVDARSDLYSLGVAFHEMLTKELPYQAEDVVSLAMKHCSEPIPKLEGPLERYQPILEKLLAKRPEERFGSAQALISALDRISTGATLHAEPYADATRVVGSAGHKTKSARTTTQQTPADASTSASRRRLPLLVAVGVFGALIAVMSWYLLDGRDRARPETLDLPEVTGPRPQGAQNYERLAFEHIADGEFQQSLEVLRLALAQFPGDPRLAALQAHAEAQREALDYQRQAERQLEADDLDEAQALIAAGLERIDNHPGLLTLRDRLARRRQQQTAEQVAALEQRAEQALNQGDLSAGMRLIEDALQLQPDAPSAQALASRIEAALEEEKTLAQLVEQAKQLMADDLLPRALALIDQGLDSAPEHPELIDLQKTVTEQLLRAARRLANRAEEAAAQGRLQEAFDSIEQALELAPDNPEIQAAEQRLREQRRQAQVEALFEQARQALAERRLQEALAFANEGLVLQPDTLGLFTFRDIIEAELEAETRIQQAARRIRALLDEEQLEQALALAERALEQDPESSELAALRGDILVRQKQRKPEQIEELLQQASRLYREDQFDAALQRTQQGLELDPEHPSLLSLEALITEALQQRATLEQQLSACEARLPDLTDAEAGIEVLADAARCYQRVLEADASHTRARSRLGQLRDQLNERFAQRLEQADFDTAARALIALERLDPSAAEINAMRADLTRQLALIPRTISMPEGCFQIGSPDSAPVRETDEKPARVCVEAFALAVRETTMAEFARFVDETDYKTDAERAVGGAPGCYTLDLDSPGELWAYHPWANWRVPNKYQGQQRGDLPVSCVSRNDALAYIQWLNQRTGQRYRLPTEAEWEYAARAGTTSSRFWGDDADDIACEYANIADTGHDWSDGFPCNDGHEWAAPVGAYRPNPWGLYDILGNLSEWTCSTYEPNYLGAESLCAAETSRDPISLRGGAWNSGPDALRSAHRNRNFPESRYSFVGFRLAK